MGLLAGGAHCVSATPPAAPPLPSSHKVTRQPCTAPLLACSSAGLPSLVEQFGEGDPSVGLIHNQLALWEFYTANYAAATEAATAAHKVWVSVRGQGGGGWEG